MKCYLSSNNQNKVDKSTEDTSLGDNKKSLAFSLYFEDTNKTLTLEEVLDIFNKISIDVSNKYNATLRNC